MLQRVRLALRTRPLTTLCISIVCLILVVKWYGGGSKHFSDGGRASPLGRHGQLALAKGDFDVEKQRKAVNPGPGAKDVDNARRPKKIIPTKEEIQADASKRPSRIPGKQHVLEQKAENSKSLDREADDEEQLDLYADLAEDALDDGNQRYDDEHDGEPFTDHGDPRQNYHEIYSRSRSNRKYYPIHFDGIGTKNANLIPHPTASDMWIAVASHVKDDASVALWCSVGMMNEVLICEKTPEPIDVAPNLQGLCDGVDEADALNALTGPRDMRVFWGPDKPYATYMSQSRYACVGVWLQDARHLLAPHHAASVTESQLFSGAMELRRPKTAAQSPASIEKNYFLFWDAKGTAYVHFDLWPKRSFAKLDYDGSVGDELAAEAGLSDQVCLHSYMPILNRDPEVHESIQQATNTLSVTLCKRQQVGCRPSVKNTFNMHIFHRRRSHKGHDTYQPYIILFENEAPFKTHAIGERALWVHGRSLLSSKSNSIHYMSEGAAIPTNHSESFYITSMAWKRHNQRYHGYLDDTIWLNFGREDSQSGTMDVTAEDLIQQMNLC